MPPHIEIKKERSVRIDAELWHTSYCLLKAGQENELGSTHQFRASLIFTAFAFEAYLNHIGPAVIKSWPEIERKLAPHEKLSLVCERLSITIDWASRPWQCIKQLFRFRNSVAHGRGEQLKESSREPIQHYQRSLYELPLTEWEKYALEKTALRTREDVQQASELIQTKCGKSSSFPFMHGMQFVSASYKQES